MAELTFLGVRGSYPIAARNYLDFGGNTSSVVIEAGEELVFLDAGTGIVENSRFLFLNKKKNISIFLSHFHLDHIQGLPYFSPFYDPDFNIKIYCMSDGHFNSKESLLRIFNPPFHPVKTEGLRANVKVIELDKFHPEEIQIGRHISVDYAWNDSHQNLGVMVYRVNVNNKSIVYATDLDAQKGFNTQMTKLAMNCDILIHDSQYWEKEQDDNDLYVNNGHSSVTMAINSAKMFKADQLYLYHYSPKYDDQVLTKLKDFFKNKNKNLFLSYEGLKLDIRRD